MNLLLHPQTKDRLSHILNRPPHGLLITGVAGSGKSTVADYIGSELLGRSVHNHPYVFVINPDEPSIKIDHVRELKSFLKLRVPTTKDGINRLVIIVSAERMTADAQNNLLKTLEEPPEDTVLILTAESTDSLLSTIVSRAQELNILPVSPEHAKEYFGSRGIPAAKLASAYALSMGQVGLLSALLNDEEHPLKEKVEIAKSILATPAGLRLKQVDSLAKDKPAIKLLLNALGRIAHAALVGSIKQSKEPQLKQWHAREELVLQAKEDFNRSANTKLLLTNLLLNL